MTKKSKTSLLKFPCEFPIKVMGPATLEFQSLVLGIVRKHAPDLGESAVKITHSKSNNYVSVTATINAKSQQQLDDLYHELSKQKDVLMTL